MNVSGSLVVREAAWRMSQDGENLALAARARAEFIGDVSSHFEFTRDSENCFFTACGFPVQLAMTLTEKQTRRAYRVVCKDSENVWFWYVENMAGCPFNACDLIDCVRMRIGAKLAGHLTGPVRVGGKAAN